jgi:hypothetical protein
VGLRAGFVQEILGHQTTLGGRTESQHAVNLIRLSLEHPLELERVLRQIPKEEVISRADNSPLKLAKRFGGEAVYQTIVNCLLRIQLDSKFR